MMVAVIQEIKEKYPDAKLIVNNNNPDENFIRSQYGNNFELRRKASFYRFVSKYHLVRIAGLFSRKLACFLTDKHAVKGANVVLNIGGFQFGDQWNHNDANVNNWRDYLRQLHKFGVKTVFMPQAFGPFNKAGSKKVLDVLNNDADILIARDDVSYRYMLEGGVSKEKVFLYPDFTASVKGIETEYSKKYAGRVCMIPNSKIVQTGIMNEESYIGAIISIINHIYEASNKVVLLNHEGAGDYKLCMMLKEKSACDIPVVTGLNALETKGLIAASHLVVSSRFHGVANSLSSCVPCLATSWSHKYQKLLEEYKQRDCLLDLSDLENTYKKIDMLLDIDVNVQTRQLLDKMNSEVMDKNREMWDMIWNNI